MNYFEIMEIPVSFQLDEDQLRRKYYENSKKFHPDFHTMSDEDKKEEVLELSTLNNIAFKTLNNFDNRFKYVLQLTGTIEEGEKYELSPDFLMEMMEINEELMELQFDFDASKFEKLSIIFKKLEKNINDSITNRIHSIPFPKEGEEKLTDLKDLYYRKKYLLRIKENLDKFAPLQ